jgi:hypothetical protein
VLFRSLGWSDTPIVNGPPPTADRDTGLQPIKVLPATGGNTTPFRTTDGVAPRPNSGSAVQ